MSQQQNQEQSIVPEQSSRAILKLNKPVQKSPKTVAGKDEILDESNDNSQETAVNNLDPKQDAIKKKTYYLLSKEEYKELLQIVRKKYPLAFNHECRPLAIHSHKQLYQDLEEIPKKKIKAF